MRISALSVEQLYSCTCISKTTGRPSILSDLHNPLQLLGLWDISERVPVPESLLYCHTKFSCTDSVQTRYCVFPCIKDVQKITGSDCECAYLYVYEAPSSWIAGSNSQGVAWIASMVQGREYGSVGFLLLKWVVTCRECGICSPT